MPTRDSWPGDVASGSSLSINSARRCDCMINVNSGYSGNSMEHLSAEERACLTFLEETIDSLETEDDSNVSNGNPDHKSRTRMANKMAYASSISQVSPGGLSVHDDPNKYSPKNPKSHKLLVPTPLLQANGNAKLLKKTDFSPKELKPATLANPNPKSIEFNPNQVSGFLTSPNPGRRNPNSYLSSEVIESPPPFIPEPPVRLNTSSVAVAKDIPPKSSLDPGSDQKHKSVSSDVPVVLIPPPSDFMDESWLHPPVDSLPAGQNKPHTTTPLSSQPVFQFPSRPCQGEGKPRQANPVGFDGHIGTNDPLTSLATSPRGQLSPNDLDELRKKASLKKAPDVTPVVQVKSAHNVSPQANTPTFGPDTSADTGVQYEEPKSPPNVAPKPKILPPSIVLKSHKEATPGHALVAPGARMMINKQKVHLEALKKLGLLKNDEIDSGLCSSPSNTSPNPSTFTVSERTPDPVHVHAQQHAAFTAQEKTEFSHLSVQPEKVESLLAIRAPSPKPYEIKSASMERSGVGLKSLTLENASRKTRQEESPENVPGSFGHLRSRPASGDSFKGVGVKQIPSESNGEPELRRSLPIPVPSQPKTESQKSLRSHGISVVISPQSTNGDDFKQALRRLGLGLVDD